MQISRPGEHEHEQEHEQYLSSKYYGYFSAWPDPMKTEGLPDLYYSDCIRKLFNLNEATLNPVQKESESEFQVLYHPNWVEWSKRVAAGNQYRAARLPFGWPERLTGPCAWQPGDVQEQKGFIHLLTEIETNEIRTALEFAKGILLSSHPR